MGEGDNQLNIYTPTAEQPNDPYLVIAYIDFASVEFSEPIPKGAVIECISEIPIDVSGRRTIWYGDE